MGFAEQLERTNRAMIAFDLALGTGALLAPGPTLRVLGHDEPVAGAVEQVVADVRVVRDHLTARYVLRERLAGA